MEDGGTVYSFGDLPINKIPLGRAKPNPRPEEKEVDLGDFGSESIGGAEDTA